MNILLRYGHKLEFTTLQTYGKHQENSNVSLTSNARIRKMIELSKNRQKVIQEDEESSPT